MVQIDCSEVYSRPVRNFPAIISRILQQGKHALRASDRRQVSSVMDIIMLKMQIQNKYEK